MTAPEFTDDSLRDAEAFLESAIVASYGPPTKRQPASNQASRCGHPCAWYLWAIRARHVDIPSPDDGLPGIWALGREAENAAQIALLQQGWNLSRNQVTFEDAALDIRGRLDWELQNPSHPIWANPIPTEFKGCSPNYFPKLNSFDDCFESPMPWVRLWPYQVLTYAFMMPEERPLVCLLLRNKVSARPKAIVERADDHFDKLVLMGERLAEVNHALREGGEPTCMPFDPVFCKNCEASHICPTMKRHTYGTAPVVLDNSDLIDSLADSWVESQEAKNAANAAWESMKEIARHYGLYDINPGEERSVISGRYVYSTKASTKGTVKFSVTPLAEVVTGGEE